MGKKEKKIIKTEMKTKKLKAIDMCKSSFNSIVPVLESKVVE